MPRRYFNDFAVFQARDFNESGPASVNFSSPLRQCLRDLPAHLLPPKEFLVSSSEVSTFVLGSQRREKKWCVSVPSKRTLSALALAFFFRCVTRGSRNSTLMAIYNMKGCTISEMEKEWAAITMARRDIVKMPIGRYVEACGS